MSEITTTPLEEKKDGKALTLKHCEIVCDVDKLKVDIQKTCMTYTTIKEWAYINHNQDKTREHYHIYLHFGGASVDMRQVAKWFNVPFNLIQKIKGRKTDYLKYLIHGNESQKFKHPYKPEEVTANFDWQFEINQAEIIGDFENFSYAEQIKYVNSIKDSSERATAFTKLEKLWKCHCKALCLQTDRNMQVVFISGKAGTGKTTYAKKLCKELNFDFCVSSSSNDLFQDYMGQKAMILDDLRDKAFKHFEDLLKILDNNTNSSVGSRFNNKVFNGKLIIITSSIPLNFWFRGKNADGKYFNIPNEDLKQLYRRISNYVEVSMSDILVYSSIDDIGKPTGKAIWYRNELQDLKKDEKEKINIIDVFDKMCGKGRNYNATLEENQDTSGLPF